MAFAGGCGTSPSAGSGSATLCWNAPARNTDGTPLADLAGYRLYWGRSAGGPYPNSVDISDPSTTRYVVDGLADGDWYFVTTAVNEDGVESDYSTELEKTIVDGSAVSCCCDE